MIDADTAATTLNSFGRLPPGPVENELPADVEADPGWPPHAGRSAEEADLQPRRPRPRARRSRPRARRPRPRPGRSAHPDALSEPAATAAQKVFQEPRELAIEVERVPAGPLLTAWSRTSVAAGVDRIPMLLVHLDGAGLLAVMPAVNLPEALAASLIRGAEPFLRDVAGAIGRAAA